MDIRQQIKEKAKSTFADRVVHKIHITEWDATIYFKTPNLATWGAVQAEAGNDRVGFAARLVVACSTDELGEKLWSKAEYKDLMTSYAPDVVMRIAAAITSTMDMSFNPQQLADDEKN